MKKLIVAGCMSALFACSNTNEFDAKLDSQVSQPATNTQPVAQPNPSVTPMPVTSETVTTAQPVITSVPVPATTTTTTTATSTTAKGMNPPHGQPGHRCDIAVGAPLNSPPATTTNTVPGKNITVTPTTTTSQVKTAAGMNPAHGQPGHRCDIAVGAPLNSPAATPGTTTQVVPAKAEETKPAADQWKADIKPDNKPQKDSSRN